MITRRTTLLIADLLEKVFRRSSRSSHTFYYTIDTRAVYDFLFENDYPAWFCNAGKAAYGAGSTRPFIEFILQIHTGESLVALTPQWNWPQREKRGQELLKELAEDIIRLAAPLAKDASNSSRDMSERIDKCRRSLELDGYTFRGDVLLAPEADVLDAQEEGGVLRDLYLSLKLGNHETVFHHLTLSEEHYMAKRWDDSISNSRKFLEGCLQEVAACHHLATAGTPIGDATYTRPVKVREYLGSAGLLEGKEKDAVSSIYGLLSETGGHPYMAQSDQARLLRHMALTLSQFVLLRLRGSRPGA